MTAWRLLRYALTRTFYRVIGLRVEYWRRVVEKVWGLDTNEYYEELERWLTEIRPLDSKGRQVTSLSELQSAPITTKENLRAVSKSKRSSGSFFHRHTAGSSGYPTDVWLTQDELGRMLGVRDYCFERIGIRLGFREGRLWARAESGGLSWIKNILLNRQVFVPVGDKLAVEAQNLVAWRPEYLYGYASLVMECARELDRTGQKIDGLRCVVVTAETILPSQKAYLGKIFGCKVYEEYGASEFDIIALECPDGHRHLVNPWLVVETDTQNQAIISDVSRSSQSLVRYGIGDDLSLQNLDCRLLGSGREIQSLDGRTFNRLAWVSQKEHFHATVFASAVNRYQKTHKDIFQFTVIQKDYGCFWVVCDPEPSAGMREISSWLEREVKDHTGFDIQILPQDEARERWSKRHYFIQTMHDAGITTQEPEVCE